MSVFKENLEYFSSRLKSFDSITDNNLLRLDLDRSALAHAGFYYVNGDIICHACGYILKNVSDIFEPYFEHVFYTTAINRDICSYLKRTTGIDLHHTFIMHKFSLEALDIENHGPNSLDRDSISPACYLFINRFVSFSDVDVFPFSPLVLAHLGYSYDTTNGQVQCFDCKYPLSYSKSLKLQVEDHVLQSCEYMKSILGSDVSVLPFMKCLL